MLEFAQKPYIPVQERNLQHALNLVLFIPEEKNERYTDLFCGSKMSGWISNVTSHLELSKILYGHVWQVPDMVVTFINSTTTGQSLRQNLWALMSIARWEKDKGFLYPELNTNHISVVVITDQREVIIRDRLSDLSKNYNQPLPQHMRIISPNSRSHFSVTDQSLLHGQAFYYSFHPNTPMHTPSFRNPVHH